MSDDLNIAGRTFLVTGGTGLIGKELVAELARRGARRVVVLARHAKAEPWTDSRIEALEGDVTDQETADRAAKGANVIFHLAAEKRVDVCEATPDFAVRTNVGGTKAVLDAAQRAKSVELVLVASTTKAVHPTGVYGLSKAAVERMVCAQPANNVRSMAVRLAAVPGEGVIAEWRRSSSQSGEIRVTEPGMTRFVMTRGQAVSLHLRALAIPYSGVILVPDVRAYRLGDLAELFALRAGAQIRVIGSRPGEAMRDYLVSEEEAADAERLPTGDIVITPGLRRTGVQAIDSEHAVKLGAEELLQVFQLGQTANV